MRVHVTNDKYVNFESKLLVNVSGRDNPSYLQFPERRVVYIFHLNPLSENFDPLSGNWPQKHKILYIGETNRQGLRGRIPINYRGKIRPRIEEKKLKITDVYVTYCEIEETNPFPYQS